MRRVYPIGSAVVFVLLYPQLARAALTLMLASDAPDLDRLVVGQPLVVRVELSGVNAPADGADFLAATVAFDETAFGADMITAGSIVPDPSGFQSAIAPGLVDANYDALFATSQDPIASNGMFYSFQIIPSGIGSGEFALSFVSAMNGTSAVPVEAGAALSYRVIPEPASGALLMMSLPIFAAFRRI